MIQILDPNLRVSAKQDDYEPNAEWLGGEAWVNLVPTFFATCDSTRDLRAEPAASDWIPI